MKSSRSRPSGAAAAVRRISSMDSSRGRMTREAPSPPCRLQGFGMGDVGQGGQVQLSPVARLAGQFQQAGVLKDEGVAAGRRGPCAP